MGTGEEQSIHVKLYLQNRVNINRFFKANFEVTSLRCLTKRYSESRFDLTVIECWS